ncbi:MAG: response regulator [Treponema sp.]|jgi:two-component system cell cycle response regulator|nr:response regulator [Treponema sp.]
MKMIVHVDNSEFFRKLMKTFFTEQGFLGESFSHGAEALKVICRGDASVVITGMALADMDGIEFIKRIDTSSYTGPIIVLTSNASKDEQLAQEALGVKVHILKSGSWQEELLPHLYACLDHGV